LFFILSPDGGLPVAARSVWCGGAARAVPLPWAGRNCRWKRA